MTYQLLTLILFATTFFSNGREVRRLDLRPENETPPPPLVSGRLGAHTAVPGSSEGPPKPEWTLTLVALETSGSSTKYEIRLTNIGEHTLKVPTGPNGRIAVEKCPDSRIQEADLSFLSRDNRSLASFHLYGCQTLANTLVSVNPGDWITLTGVYALSSQKSEAAEISAHFGLVASHYYLTKEGWLVDKQGVIDIDSGTKK
jgi:hypothetical protein